MSGLHAVRVAARLRRELGIEVDTIRGHYGEYKVLVDGDGPMSPSDDASGRSVAGAMPLKQNRDTCQRVEGIDETAGVVSSTEAQFESATRV